MSTSKSKMRLRNTSVVFPVGDIAATIPSYVDNVGFSAFPRRHGTASVCCGAMRSRSCSNSSTAMWFRNSAW